MSDRKVRFAIVGCGGIGKMHAELLRGHPHAEVVWAVDEWELLAYAFAHEMGIPRATPDLTLALSDPDVDAVLITTDPHHHFDAAVMALESGKHVLIEKPIAADVYEAEQIVHVAEEQERVLMVNQHYRWDPVMTLAKEYLMGASLGRLLYARCFCEMWMPLSGWRAEAEQCTMLDMGVHIVDLLRWLTGRDVVEVAAFARRINPEVAGDTVAQVLLLLEGDVPVTMTVSWASRGQQTPVHGSHHLVFEEGSVEVGSDVSVFYRDPNRPPDVPPHPRWNLDINSLMMAGISGAHDHFLDCVLTGAIPLTSGRDNLNTIRTVFGVYQSSREGRLVKIPPD